MNNCLSGTMSLGANLLSIFVPSYFLTVTKNNLVLPKFSELHVVKAVQSMGGNALNLIHGLTLLTI